MMNKATVTPENGLTMMSQPMTQITLTVPEGMQSGQQIQFNANGQMLQTTIPQGLLPGQQFIVNIPVGGQAPQVMDMNKNLITTNSIQNQGNVKGFSYLVQALEQVKAIQINQEIFAIELCGWEHRNEYRLYPFDPANPSILSPQFLHVAEESDCLERQCCSTFRSARLNIHHGFDRNGELLGIMLKDFHLNLCLVFMRPKMNLIDANGTHVGKVEDPFACLVVNQTIHDQFGNKKYTITGSIFQCASICPCSDFKFTILDANKNPVGSIQKVFNGCNELLMGANKFSVIFPPTASGHDKALLLSATFLLDFGYFEKDKNSNQ